jgi:hypothetical protein
LSLVNEDDRKAMIPDYGRDINSICMSLVNLWINRDKSLDFLVQNRFDVDGPEPSWFPDLHAKAGPDGTPWWNGVGRWFSASGDTPCQVSIDPDKMLMSVKGIQLDVINATIGPLNERPITKVEGEGENLTSVYFNRLYQVAPRQMKLFALAASCKGPWFETCWRTLTMNFDYWDSVDPVSPAPESLGETARKIYYEKWSKNIGKLFTTGKELIGPWEWNLRKTLKNRSIFTTEDGKLGIGPFCCQEGDIVAVVFGADYLLVLRPQADGTYKRIGDAYIRHAMHGETIIKNADGAIQNETTFELS